LDLLQVTLKLLPTQDITGNVVEILYIIGSNCIYSGRFTLFGEFSLVVGDVLKKLLTKEQSNVGHMRCVHDVKDILTVSICPLFYGCIQ
jgi:hypothetical protein